MKTITRFEDWDIRLDAYLLECARKPFAWGEHDCCLFVCGAIFEMTGVDPAVGFRGHYSTRAAAYRLLGKEIRKAGPLKPVGDCKPCRKAGFIRAIGAICSIWGFPVVPVPLARRGDAVIVRDTEATTALGIVALDGTRVAVLAPDGLTYYPLASALAAWRI